MPALQQHIAQAVRNEEFADTISSLQTRFTQWEITALFYSVLHYADAFLATRGHHPSNHQERRRLVAQFTGFQKEYENLYDLSIKARYATTEFTPQDIEKLKAGDFRTLKEGITALLPS